MHTQVAPPLTRSAFDDPGTRAHWTRAFRLTLTNLLVRAAVWVALLVTAKVAEDDAIAGPASLLSMITAFLLILPSIKLRWLLMVGRVLKSGPWQACSAVLRNDVKRQNGKAVEVRFDDAYEDSGRAEPVGGGSTVLGKDSGAPGKGGAATVGEGARLLRARTWRSRIRWSDELTEGAWVVVDDPRLPGVLARPGGSGFMTLHGS
ncbi:hypothetical protein QIS99_01475 [Streptomyces sp. B-S-A8]|uniref:Uncharacterized protein n=1 Tax=Streptomyces solicavernae TaxID=3043614 RepID=A0ABT6RKD9_9ACTN|nr:hypothetical protein [Streptomyces sp. B-S-A8]MDI3384892.1 hypothetical protein [Streptomyces sp. B-S-A8]